MRNIIITGGELFNKGAQAMVFITVDEMKKRFPNHQIYVLSEMDYRRSDKEKDIYNFQFTCWYPLKYAKAQTNPLTKLMCMVKNHKEYKEVFELYSQTDFMLDISGYALGSNWGYQYCNSYLEHLIYAEAFNIPVYLLPQSFGPFDFKGDEGINTDALIKKLLPNVKLIFAREQDGYNMLKENYHLNNVIKTYDLVLNNKNIDLKNIYKEIPEFNVPLIENKSVAIIPNSRNKDVGNNTVLIDFYKVCINELLRRGYFIYLLSHSTGDVEICNEIKQEVSNDKVILIDDELSCIEFNQIAPKFDFMIASRFHSIVHAYKNSVPCIILGWAIKYQELAAQYSQEKYLFDVRNEIDINEVVGVINELIENLDKETLVIKEKCHEIQKENIFDLIEL